MKLASLNTGDPDGRLLVVSRNLSVAVDAGFIAPNMLSAVERWAEVAPRLQGLSDEINAGKIRRCFHSIRRHAPRRCRVAISGAMPRPFSTTAS